MIVIAKNTTCIAKKFLVDKRLVLISILDLKFQEYQEILILRDRVMNFVMRTNYYGKIYSCLF